MSRKLLSSVGATIVVFLAGFWMGRTSPVEAQTKGRVFELRTYTAHPGKLGALHARFRDHSAALFEKHGITNIAYWSPQDEPASSNMLIYVLAHPSREAATKSWDAFRNDPAWQKARADSEVNGPLASKVESVFLEPTDYSPMK